jgi:hypothetical protein
MAGTKGIRGGHLSMPTLLRSNSRLGQHSSSQSRAYGLLVQRSMSQRERESVRAREGERERERGGGQHGVEAVGYCAGGGEGRQVRHGKRMQCARVCTLTGSNNIGGVQVLCEVVSAVAEFMVRRKAVKMLTGSDSIGGVQRPFLVDLRQAAKDGGAAGQMHGW